MFAKINLLCSRIRLEYIKQLHRSSRIIIRGFSNVNRNTDIEVEKKSLLVIGRGLHTRKGCLLAVRQNAKLKIGNNCFINRNTCIVARKSVVIGDCVTIGPNVCIYDHDHDVRNKGEYISGDIVIMRGAWIGAGSIILKGVTIGENAIVASGCVVTKDIPSNHILIQKRNNHYSAVINVAK